MNFDESQIWWMALAHSWGIRAPRKMDILIHMVHGAHLSLKEALEQIVRGETELFFPEPKEYEALERLQERIPEYRTLAYNLEGTDISMITVMDSRYPRVMKKLQKKKAPLLLYVRGNVDLLNASTVGIEGTRDASSYSIRFTDHILRNALHNHQVMVGGFINPIEKQVIDTTLAMGGKAIIILAEGISRFYMPEYDKFLSNGQLLLVSPFHPNEERTLRTTMDRNMLFYDFCNTVFIAESSAIGGGWDGAMLAVTQRPVYVRIPIPGEENFNDLLIQNGGIAVDEQGNPGDFEQIEASYRNNPIYRISEYDPDNPRTTSQYRAYLMRRLEKSATLSLSDFFKERNLTDRMKCQLENIFNVSPQVEKIRVGNKAVYVLKGKNPQQGKLSFD